MYTGKVVTFAHSDTPLAAVGAGAIGKFLSNWIQVGTDVLQKQIPGGGFTMLRGFVNSNVAGTLDIFQGWDLLDIVAITQTVPAVAVSNAALFLQTFPFASAGVANAGTPFLVAIVAPFVRVRFTNGGVVQATFRIHFEVAE